MQTKIEDSFFPMQESTQFHPQLEFEMEDEVLDDNDNDNDEVLDDNEEEEEEEETQQQTQTQERKKVKEELQENVHINRIQHHQQQQQQQHHQLDAIIGSDMMSPEPFSHPSSPIHQNDSLTHENLHMLDHSLTLTDNGQEQDDSHIGIDNHSHSHSHSHIDIHNSSYISFPSNGSHSRANSIVSSAVQSTSTTITNNTTNGNPITRRRRPRPWDKVPDGETTPLLPSKQQKHLQLQLQTQLQHPPTPSIYNIKTAKRGNIQGRIFFGNDNDNGNGNDDANPIESGNESPSLQWSKGVFTDHYGSIADEATKGYQTPSQAQAQSQYAYMQLKMRQREPSAPVITFITAMTVMQFILMAIYNIFLHYQSMRLSHQPPYAFWFSDAGRIYNAGIGPNVPTLILFGVFHPILAMEEWWRMGSALFCCTSLVEFILNIFWLRVLSDLEEERNQRFKDYSGSWSMGFVFGLSGLMGGLAQMVGSNGEDVVVVTGLNGPGIVGCMAAMLMMDWHSKGSVRRYKGNEGEGGSGRKVNWCAFACDKMSFLHASILSEVLCGLFLPYTSVTSVMFGALMGVCGGMFLLKQDYDWTDADSQASSVASDLEEAFSPSVKTPPRFHYEDSPPPPPSSSSKGLDTPIMRRSILTSPEDDDEYDVVQSLNKSGGKGLKQRNIGSAQKKTPYSSINMNMNVNMNATSSSGKHNVYRQNEYFCTEARLRFIGMMAGLLMLSISVLYIGFTFTTPSDQVVSDSLYGCKTMYGIYRYEQDGNDADDGVTNASNVPAEGDTVCGDVCIPISIYDRVMSNGGDSVSALEYGACSQNGYSCMFSNEAYDVGFIEIEQDLFTQGECDQNGGNTK